MKVGHWLAPAGLTKEMILGSIVDAIEARDTIEDLDSLGGISLQRERLSVGSITCVRATVEAPLGTPDISDVESLNEVLSRLELTGAALDICSRVYHNLFQAEAEVHDKPLEEVRLHASGSFRNAAIVATAARGLAKLGLERITVGRIAVGRGSSDTPSHGLLPIPAPAVSYLLSGFEIESGPIAGERVSPIAAAFIRTTSEPSSGVPAMSLESTSRGADSPAIEAFASLLIGTT